MQARTSQPEAEGTVTPVVAFMDAGVWYLVRIDGPDSQAMLTRLFPDLTDLNLSR